jgi:hypothetical protein
MAVIFCETSKPTKWVMLKLRWCESPGDAARIAALSDDQAPTAITGCPHHHVRLFLDLREDEIGVSLDALRSAVAAHLQRRDLSRGLDALRPTNGGRRTDINRAAAWRRDIPPATAFMTFSRISIDSAMIPLPSHDRVQTRRTLLMIWESRA